MTFLEMGVFFKQNAKNQWAQKPKRLEPKQKKGLQVNWWNQEVLKSPCDFVPRSLAHASI